MLTVKDVTPAIKSAVSAYLIAKAHAELLREQVDQIQRLVLAQCPLSNGLEVKHGKEPREITDPRHVYLCTDEALVRDYYAECDHQERKAGIKPSDMELDYCPALVAESLVRDMEHLIIECAAEMMGKDLTVNKLLSAGLEKYQRFIDLCCGLVVNLPDFKNPLTRKAVA